jgi:hypothetical protein
MTKYPTIKSSMKLILAFFAATMMCAVFFAIPASAAPTWTSDQDFAGGPGVTYTVEINSTTNGTITLGAAGQGGELTVISNGTVTLNNNIGFNLGTGSVLYWNASFEGSRTLTISGSGTVVFGNGVTIETSGSPAVTLGAGLTSVTINGSSITSTNGTAIETSATLLTVNGGTIEGGDNGNTSRDSAVYGIDIDEGTAVLNGGRITTASTDEVNNQDSAIHVTGNGHIRIAGAEIHGGKMNGVSISSSYSTLTMTSGTVTGRDAIHALTALSVSLSGGNISTNSNSTSSDAAVHISDVPTGIISGNVIIDGGNATGVEILDTFHPGTRIDFTMDGGTIKGKNALHLSVVGTANITGGIITATGSAPEAGIKIGYQDPYVWENTYQQTITIGGNVDINGGTSGIHIIDSGKIETMLNITGGEISGENGLIIEEYDIATTNITGGTISGTGVGGFGIIDSTGGTVAIAPTVSVTVQGGGSALDTTPTVNTPYYFTGENYDGSGRIPFKSSEIPFVNDLLYKYVQFLVAEPIFPTAPAPAPGPDYSTPSTAMDPLNIPEIKNPNGDVIPEWIEVIATLNKSGTVNSKETAADVAAAHDKAERLGGGVKIKLIITDEGTGISKTAMQKVYKAAGGTSIYLTFDFYETSDDEISDGNVFVKLNEKTGQILTRVDFDSVRIDNAESYINNRWDTEILGSFETANKSGWGDKAAVSVSAESLGITAVDNQKYYVLIHDTKTKKWYQTTGTAKDGEIVINTSRSGVVAVVTDAVN